MKTGFLSGRWVRANRKKEGCLYTMEPDPNGQSAVLSTYDGEGFWRVNIFHDDLPLLQQVERKLAGENGLVELIVHEDDLSLDERHPPLSPPPISQRRKEGG